MSAVYWVDDNEDLSGYWRNEDRLLFKGRIVSYSYFGIEETRSAY